MKRLLCFFVFFLCMLSVLSVSASQNLVSLHARYELLTPASNGYPDDDGDLTNGKYGTPVENGTDMYYYRDSEYVGFKRDDANTDGNFAVLLDLAEDFAELWDFEVGYLHEPSVGITAPSKVAFYIAEEKDGDYTFVGETVPKLPQDKNDSMAGIAVVSPDQPVSGRYVMCVITPAADAGWVFLDEISVLQGQNPLNSQAEETPTLSSATESFAAGSAGESVSPQTGDSHPALLILLCAASALGCVALIGRRRSL